MTVIGQRIKQLRLARGLSMDALVLEMGGVVTKQAISKYETGKARPAPAVLCKLAEVLQVRAASLLETSVPEIQMIAYRKRSRLPVKEMARIESSARLLFEERIGLQRICNERMDSAFPLQGRRIKTVAEAEDAAEELRGSWALGLDPIGDLVATLEERAVHVVALDADEAFDGLSLYTKDDTGQVVAAVVCRTRVPGERQRLSLAHELGHLVLDVGEDVDEEKAAFRFAAAFLAPRSTLLRDVGAVRRRLDVQELFLLKRRFGISLQALLYRLKDLEVIGENSYREWCIAIGRHGWRREEPEPLPPEQSVWLPRTVLRAVAEGWLDVKEGERLLGRRIEIPDDGDATMSRTALMRLPVEERRKRLEKDADRLLEAYPPGGEGEEGVRIGGGDFVEY